MSRARVPAWLSAIAALCASLPVAAADFDVASSEIGFSLVTRWGTVVDGRFPVFDGYLTRLPDGRQQVRLSLSAADVEIIGNQRHTRLSRGRGFFEAARFPWLTFVSEPFGAELLAAGGPLPGQLHIRDVERREVFSIAPSACARPALDCPVLAHGVVERSRYGMNRWNYAIGGKVYFQLSLRLADAGP